MADETGFGHCVVLGGVTLLGGVSLFGIYSSILPEFQAMCEAADMALPVVTKWMLQLSAWTVRFWYFILPIIIVGPLPPLFLLSRGKGQRILAHMTVIQLLTALFTIGAMWPPFHLIGVHIREDARKRPAAQATAAPPSAENPAAPSPTAAPR
jgi:hypothetical protein